MSVTHPLGIRLKEDSNDFLDLIRQLGLQDHQIIKASDFNRIMLSLHEFEQDPNTLGFNKLNRGDYTGNAQDLKDLIDAAYLQIAAAAYGIRPFESLADANNYYTTNPPSEDVLFVVTSGNDKGEYTRYAADNTNSLKRLIIEIEENGIVAGSEKAVTSGAVFEALPLQRFLDFFYGVVAVDGALAVNSSYEYSDNELSLTLSGSGAGWIKLDPLADYIEYKVLNTAFGIAADKVLLGFKNDGKALVLYLNSTSFCKIYEVEQNGNINFSAEISSNGASHVLQNDTLAITRKGSTYEVRIKRELNDYFEDYLEFSFPIDIHQYGFITSTAQGTSRVVASFVKLYELKYLAKENRVDQLALKNTFELIKPIREVDTTDFTRFRGTGFGYEDHLLTLLGTDLPYVMLPESVKAVEYEVVAGNLGIMIGNGVDYDAIAITSIIYDRSVSDLDTSGFNNHITVMESTVPGAYGINYMSKIDKAVAGDVIRTFIVGEYKIEMLIKRVGESSFKPFWQFDIRSTYAVNIEGWENGLRLGFFSFSSANNQTVAKNIKILQETVTDFNGEIQIPIQSRLNHLERIHVFNNYWHGKKWLAIGDSITDQDRRLGLGYATFVDQMIGFEEYYVRAYSGNTIPQILGNYAAWEQDADLISIYAGVNDYLFQTSLGTEFDNDLSTTTGALTKMIQDLSTDNPTAGICLIAPNRLWGYDTLGTREPENMENAGRVDTTGVIPLIDYIERIILIGKRMGIPVLDLYHESNFNKFNMNVFTYDGLHPNLTGSQKLGRVIGSFIKRIA